MWLQNQKECITIPDSFVPSKISFICTTVGIYFNHHHVPSLAETHIYWQNKEILEAKALGWYEEQQILANQPPEMVQRDQWFHLYIEPGDKGVGMWTCASIFVTYSIISFWLTKRSFCLLAVANQNTWTVAFRPNALTAIVISGFPAHFNTGSMISSFSSVT